MPANLENSAKAKNLKKSVFIPITKKGKAKKYSGYCTIELISHASKVMLKQYWTEDFQMYKLDLEKAEEQEIKLPKYAGSQKKTREFQKNTTIHFCFTDYAKAFDYGSQQTVEYFFFLEYS